MHKDQSLNEKELNDKISSLENKLLVYEMSSKPVSWFGKFILFGPKLDKSIKGILNEVDEKGIPNKKSILFFIWALWRQIVRINIALFIIGIIPLILLVFQTIYLNKQNSLFGEQNKLIVQQSNFFKEELKFMGIQTEILQEELKQTRNSIVSDSIKSSSLEKMQEKRTLNSFTEELNSILFDIDKVLEKEENTEKVITKRNIKRLTDFTQKLEPYKYIEDGLSPEKGILLKELISRNISKSEFQEILSKGDFSNSNFESLDFRKFDISNANFKGSNFRDAIIAQDSFFYVNFRNCEFYNASLYESKFINCEFNRSSLFNSKIRGAKFQDCNFTEVDLGNIESSKLTRFLNSTFDFCIINQNDESEKLLKKINKNSKIKYSINLEEEFKKNNYPYFRIRRE